MALNPGAQQAHIDITRAVCETPMNGINAGGTITAVEVMPHTFNPLHPTGCQDAEGHHTLLTMSNTELRKEDMTRAINFGSTRGTGEVRGTQEVGNDHGVGMNEAAWALGGTPCLIVCKRTSEKTHSMWGFITSDDMMRFRTAIGVTQSDELSYVLFEAEITHVQGQEPFCDLISPVGIDQASTVAKRMLYTTGLPFCEEGTHYNDPVPLGSRRRALDDVFYKNGERFKETLVNTYRRGRAWLDAQMAKTAAVHGDDVLEEEMQAAFNCVTMSFAHNIAPNNIIKADAMQCDEKGAQLSDRYRTLIEGHRWTVRGSTRSLATLIAAQINYGYYDDADRKVHVYVDGFDVRDLNVYLPLERMQERICKQRKHPLQMHETCMAPAAMAGTGAKCAANYGSVSFCPSAVAYRDDAEGILGEGKQPSHQDTVLFDEETFGIPEVVWNDDEGTDGTPAVVWKGAAVAATRHPPPGIIFTRKGTVINPYSPSAIYTSNALFSITQEANKISKVFNEVSRSMDSMRSSDAHVPAANVLRAMCDGLAIVVKDASIKSNLRQLEALVASRLTAMNMPDVCPIPMLSVQLIEALTSTEGSNSSKGHGKEFFGQTDVGHVGKNSVRSFMGLKSSGEFKVNTELFAVDINKTAIAPLSGGRATGLTHVLRGVVLRLSAQYSMNCALNYKELNRLRKIKSDPVFVNDTWPTAQAREEKAKRDAEARVEAARRKAEHERLEAARRAEAREKAAREKAARQAEEATRKAEERAQAALRAREGADDALPLIDWFRKCNTLVEAGGYKEEGVAKTIHKNKNHDGWYKTCVPRSNPNHRGMDGYFYNENYSQLLAYRSGTRAIRGEQQLLLFQKWVDDGASRDQDTFTPQMADVLSRVLRKSVKDEIEQHARDKKERAAAQQSGATQGGGGTGKLVYADPDLKTGALFALRWYRLHPTRDPFFVPNGNVRSDDVRVGRGIAVNEFLLNAESTGEVVCPVLMHACLIGMWATDTVSGSKALTAACSQAGIVRPSGKAPGKQREHPVDTAIVPVHKRPCSSLGAGRASSSTAVPRFNTRATDIEEVVEMPDEPHETEVKVEVEVEEDPDGVEDEKQHGFGEERPMREAENVELEEGEIAECGNNV